MTINPPINGTTTVKKSRTLVSRKIEYELQSKNIPNIPTSIPKNDLLSSFFPKCITSNRSIGILVFITSHTA